MEFKIGDKVKVIGNPKIVGGVIDKVIKTRCIVKAYHKRTNKMVKYNIPITMLLKENK